MNKFQYSTVTEEVFSDYETHTAAKAWHEMGALGAEDTSDKLRTYRGKDGCWWLW